MPTFHYRAKRGSTETVTGQLTAPSQEEAVEMINRQDLVPVSVEEVGQAKVLSGGISFAKVSAKEIFYFTRQLANLIKAGIPILRALQLIYNQMQNMYLRGVIDEIISGIKGGKVFSGCLAHYPNMFNSFYIAMVRAGEESGNLKDVLVSLSKYQRSQEEIASKVRAAMAYPIFMATVGVGTVIFILTFVMPRITNLFVNAGEVLPIPTIILMKVSQAFQNAWWGILALFIGGAVLLWRWGKTETGRLVLSQIKLRMPLYGAFTLKVELACFCRTLELLLKSGSAIIKGIQIALPTIHNELVKKEFADCKKDLESGASFSGSLGKSKLIPREMINLILVGEESGSLEGILGDLADIYEQETQETIKTMTSLLEPAMILVIGAVIGFIVVAMLLPIFQIDIMAR